MKKMISFRHPINNVRYTRQMFKDIVREFTLKPDFDPPYTLHQDEEGCTNFRRVYVELGDPTGYKLSQQLLENYDHWLHLMKCPWFKKAKEQWDIELDAKLKSEGMEVIKMLSDGIEGVSPAVQLSAAKALANLDHRKNAETAKRRAGRPSSDEVEGELKREAAASHELAADLARIRSVK